MSLQQLVGFACPDPLASHTSNSLPTAPPRCSLLPFAIRSGGVFTFNALFALCAPVLSMSGDEMFMITLLCSSACCVVMTALGRAAVPS